MLVFDHYILLFCFITNLQLQMTDLKFLRTTLLILQFLQIFKIFELLFVI